jgi:hypothetical protein
VCRSLVQRGLLIRLSGPTGKIVNRLTTESSGSPPGPPKIALSSPSPGLEFEAKARRVLSGLWGVNLQPRLVRIADGVSHKFDLVSDDEAVVGDAKFYSYGNLPAAKWSTITEYVWLLEHVQQAKRRFLVFGQDRLVAEKWLARYRPLLNTFQFYFLDGESLIDLLAT